MGDWPFYQRPNSVEVKSLAVLVIVVNIQLKFQRGYFGDLPYQSSRGLWMVLSYETDE